LSPAELERYDFIVGCVKQNHNRALQSQGTLKFNMDHAFAACTCMWNVRLESSTPDERALEGKYLDAGRPINDLPHIQRAAPKYAACLSGK